MDLATLVQDDGGDAAYAELARRGRIGVDVELGDRELAFVGLGDFIEHRREHLARPAPFRPEIDQHGILRLQYVLLERGVRNVFDEIAHRMSFPPCQSLAARRRTSHASPASMAVYRKPQHALTTENGRDLIKFKLYRNWTDREAILHDL